MTAARDPYADSPTMRRFRASTEKQAVLPIVGSVLGAPGTVAGLSYAGGSVAGNGFASWLNPGSAGYGYQPPEDQSFLSSLANPIRDLGANARGAFGALTGGADAAVQTRPAWADEVEDRAFSQGQQVPASFYARHNIQQPGWSGRAYESIFPSARLDRQLRETQVRQTLKDKYNPKVPVVAPPSTVTKAPANSNWWTPQSLYASSTNTQLPKPRTGYASAGVQAAIKPPAAPTMPKPPTSIPKP